LVHVVGANASGAKIAYPAASNGSIFDIASYNFAASAPVNPVTTTPNYTIQGADQGRRIRSLVRKTNATGPSAYVPSAWSSPVGAAVSSAPVNTADPTIQGDPVDGEVLVETDRGTWDNLLTTTTFARQWQRALPGGTFVDIAGATGTSYTVTQADSGYNIIERVRATTVNGTGTAFSNVIGPITRGAPFIIEPPFLIGDMIVGETLLLEGGTWGGTQPITLSYQWQRGTGAPDPLNPGQVIITWADITGETEKTYLITSSDIGKYLRCRQGATNGV
jgi:hypothetical protein